MIPLEIASTNIKMPAQENTPAQSQAASSREGAVQPNVPVPEQQAIVSQPQTSVLTPTYQEENAQPVAPQKPGRRVPKSIFLIIGFVLVFSMLAFLLIKLRPTIEGLLGQKGEIVWWGVTRDEGVMNSLIEAYQEENPGVEIKYIKQSSKDYRERLTNTLARGEGPDIFQYHNSWVPMFKSELDTLPESIMSQQEFASTFYPIITSDLTVDGEIVGMPLGFDALTLYVNEDLFAAAVRIPPSTWDEFRQTALALTTKTERGVIIQSGAARGKTENIDHWPEILALMMVQNRVNPANPSGQLAEDALEFYSVFAREDEICDETLPPSTVAFANGKVAMYFGPTWRANEINRLNSNLRFKTVPLPQLRKDDPGAPDVSYSTYWVEGVWRRSANGEVAWDFLKFLSEREQLEKLFERTSQIQLIGEPYPRVDMSDLLNEHPVIGSVIALAANARSWYLASETFDGPTGINSQLEAIFKEAVDVANSRSSPKRALEPVPGEVAKVLSQYGIRVR